MKVPAVMRSTILALAVLATTAACGDPPAAEPSQKEIDAIVRKLETSGALDAALDRAIDRYAKRQQEAQRAAREKLEAQLAKAVPSVDPKRDHVRGPADAEASLIEYTDFECPFCKRFEEVPPKLLEQYKGRLNWVIRNFPLPFHEPAAHKEAVAAECVAKLGGNDAYWKFTDLLFGNTRGNGQGLAPEHSIDKLAATLGIRSSALDACMEDPAVRARVDEDVKTGKAAGVSATPTSVVRNNRTGASLTISGAQPLEEVAASVREVLEAKRQ